MKKLIALLLALISLVSLAGAAFTDEAGISSNYAQAVSAMNEKGIIAGFPDGSFLPDGTLTRAQAAKIICVMLEGTEKANALTSAKSSFTDVPTSHWASKFVEYCAEKGIVAGVGESKFAPDGKLTGLAFGKMLLVACGANDADMTGAGWDTVTKELLTVDDYNANVPTTSESISRQEACQLAYNFMNTPNTPEFSEVKPAKMAPEAGTYTREDAEKALVATAWAYFFKGKHYQYDNQQFTKDIINRYYGGNARLQYGSSPEDGTSDTTIYSVCSDYVTSKTIYNAWGYTMFGHFQEAVTEGLFLHAEEQGMLRIRWSNKSWSATKKKYFGISDESFKSLEETTAFFEAWEQNFRPGDIIVMNGHTMLYVGNGEILHAGGNKYNMDTGADAVEENGTVKRSTIRGLFFGLDGETTKSYRLASNKKDGYLVVLRPLDAMVEKNTGSGTDKLKAECGITPEAKQRMKYPALYVNRTASVKTYGSAVAGGEMTYTLVIGNRSNEETFAKFHKSADYASLPVTETVPEGTELVASSVTGGGKVSADGKTIHWSLDLPAGQEVTLTYTVKVTAPMGSIIVNDGGSVGGIRSNSLIHTVGGKKLSDTNKAKLLTLTGSDVTGKDTEFAENAYKTMGIHLTLPTAQQILNNLYKYVNVGGQVGFTTMGDVGGDAWILTPRTVSPAGFKTYGAMLVDGYVGGKGVYTYETQKRIFDLWEKDLEPGDILLYETLDSAKTDRKVEKCTTAIYLGKGKYLVSDDGKVQTKAGIVGEALITKAFTYDFFVCLRPSQAYADINTLTK